MCRGLNTRHTGSRESLTLGHDMLYDWHDTSMKSECGWKDATFGLNSRINRLDAWMLGCLDACVLECGCRMLGYLRQGKVDALGPVRVSRSFYI